MSSALHDGLPYGRSWDGLGEELAEEAWDVEDDGPDDDLPDAGLSGADPYYDDYDDEYEDDDDLLAALDEALDEVEAEAQIEYVRNLACPTDDALELVPMADTAYRRAIGAFMGTRGRPRAPRHSVLVRKVGILNSELGALLESNLAEARASIEKRRAEICWEA